MKKLLLILLIFSILIYSCSKVDHNLIIVAPPPPPSPLIEQPIDLNFNLNASCFFNQDDGGGYYYLAERDFYLFASCDSNVSGGKPGLTIETEQSYFLDDSSYSNPLFIISEMHPEDTNSIRILTEKNFNFFTLPYQSGVASFSDTCYVTFGKGKYKNLVSNNEPLIFSGFVDTVNGTGTIRIKGKLFFK